MGAGLAASRGLRSGSGALAPARYPVAIARPSKKMRALKTGASILSPAPALQSSMTKRSTSSSTPRSRSDAPIVGVIMGSKSDLKHMSAAVATLRDFDVACEVRVVSAHRTPDWMFEYASTAESRGIEVIIAAAGGAAHLPGMISSKTVLPVLGVPMPATVLNGVDALLSIVQMPKGVPVGTLAIGEPGAANAALLAISIVSQSRPDLRERLRAWRASRTADVLRDRDIDHTA